MFMVDGRENQSLLVTAVESHYIRSLQGTAGAGREARRRSDFSLRFVVRT
jgi:hypothetical protein